MTLFGAPGLPGTRIDRALALVACASLGFGVFWSLQAAQIYDLRIVSEWTESWVSRINPYAGIGSTVDYPPWALVVLSPLAAVREAWRPALWIVVNLALVVALITRLVDATRDPRRARLRLALLLASMACLRTLPQFSLLSYTLAIYGALSPTRFAGGVLLGLSLIKPQIGGPVLLATMLCGDWRRVVVALSVPVALTAVFATWVHASVTAVLADYAGVISRVYGSPAFQGHTEVRTWLWSLWPTVTGNVILTAGLALVLVTPGTLAAWTRRLRPAVDLELIALCGVVSLLVQRHLSYDLILLLPAVVAWRPSFEVDATPAPRWMFAGLTVLLIAAIPSLARLGLRAAPNDAFVWLTQMDRLLCIGVWMLLSLRLLQRPRSPVGVRSAEPTSVVQLPSVPAHAEIR